MTRTIHHFVIVSFVAAGVLLGTGCGKKQTEEVKPIVPPSPTKTTTSKTPPTTPPATPPATTSTGTPGASVAIPPGTMPMPLTAADAQKITQLESAYRTSSDYGIKVEAIYKISDTGGAEAVAALGRLFAAEKDPEMRVELVSSLYDIDGEDQQKLAILTAAVAADQPQDVREEAIDALTDVEPKIALPILRALTSDANEDIRDAAKDGVEILEMLMRTEK